MPRVRKLALFARRPVPGRVKTRLSPALPAPLACELHRAMVLDALAVLSVARADERALYWDAPGDESEEVPAGVHVRTQRGGDLGERLAAAFEELLAGGGQAVVFGTDCPALDPAALHATFAALEESDLALTPATDGGYVAIGLARPAPEIFRGIAWSTGAVLEQTLERARGAGLRARTLDAALDDLDTPEDLLRHLARQLGEGAMRAPALDRALRGMGLMPPA